MISQRALTSFPEASTELQVLLVQTGQRKEWPQPVINGLVSWVQETQSRHDGLIFDDVDLFWRDIAGNYEVTLNNLTNGNKDSLQEWRSLKPFFSNASGTAFDAEQATGFSGAVNLAQDQLDEVARDIKETKTALSPKKPLNLALYVLGGYGLLYLLLRRS